jgi:hypothetical protein
VVFLFIRMTEIKKFGLLGKKVGLFSTIKIMAGNGLMLLKKPV